MKWLIIVCVPLGVAIAAFYFFDGPRHLAIASTPKKTARIVAGDPL